MTDETPNDIATDELAVRPAASVMTLAGFQALRRTAIVAKALEKAGEIPKAPVREHTSLERENRLLQPGQRVVVQHIGNGTYHGLIGKAPDDTLNARQKRRQAEAAKHGRQLTRDERAALGMTSEGRRRGGGYTA